jgi:hypothetical protein
MCLLVFASLLSFGNWFHKGLACFPQTEHELAYWRQVKFRC